MPANAKVPQKKDNSFFFREENLRILEIWNKILQEVFFCCQGLYFEVPTLQLVFSPEEKPYMTMENQPFEDVSPIKTCDFPLSC